jgi:hypothetical protein
LRATATVAFLVPILRARRVPQGHCQVVGLWPERSGWARMVR